jgi:hypothetical protein
LRETNKPNDENDNFLRTIDKYSIIFPLKCFILDQQLNSTLNIVQNICTTTDHNQIPLINKITTPSYAALLFQREYFDEPK